MSGRSVHFALSAADRKRVLAATEPDVLIELITEDIEERYMNSGRWCFELDKAWDALHRSLTDGRLLYATGPFPLAYAVLGGAPLDAGEDYTACLADPDQVADAALALSGVTRPWLHSRYFALNRKHCGYDLTEEDFEYTWTSFLGLPAFFRRAAKAKRSILFTVDA